MTPSRIYILSFALLLVGACSSDVNEIPSATCGPGQVQCGADCADVLFDRLHCGGCGVVCAAGEVCDSGTCAATCTGGTTRCGDACVDTDGDAANCGGCGNACDEGTACVDGACACPQGTEVCDGACVALGADPAHCGACGNACGEGELCVDGACAVACEAGQVNCDGACVDIEADDANCGACGVACTGGTFCTDGACACPAGETLCGDTCVDLQADAANCGGCGMVCAAGENASAAACTEGVCVSSCEEGFADCDGDAANGCEVALAADAANCGACGNACGDEAYCAEGICCGTDGLICDGACIDPLADDAHCGGCGEGCAGLPNSTGGTCVDGGCELACAGAFDDCNFDRTDGCESDLQSDAGHCGACGNACSVLCGGGACLTASLPEQLFGTTCTLLSDGSVWCWGLNDQAQVGDAAYQNRSTPYRVPVQAAAEVAPGPYHTCVRTLAGGVSCWGMNHKGQLGGGHSNQTAEPETLKVGDQPVLGVAQLALTGHPTLSATQQQNGSTCALLGTGQVQCWGGGANGRLGNGSSDDQLAPVTVTDGTAPLTGVAEIAAGGGHVCARKTDGTVWCWGWNHMGQLGLDDTNDRSVATQVAGLSGVDQIAAAGFRTCARLGGAVKCWGQNTVGQVGDGTTTQRNTPTDVTGLAGVSDIAVGMNHACALLADTTAKCWGMNYSGQLGDGSTTNRHAPVAMLDPGQSGPWTGLKGIAAGGQSYTCTIDADDRVWCWGLNVYGQLGDGTTSTSDVPVPVIW